MMDESHNNEEKKERNDNNERQRKRGRAQYTYQQYNTSLHTPYIHTMRTKWLHLLRCVDIASTVQHSYIAVSLHSHTIGHIRLYVLCESRF